VCTSAPLQAGRALTLKENHSYLFSRELMIFHHQTSAVFAFLTSSSLELFLIHLASLSTSCIFSSGPIPSQDCFSKVDTGASTELASSFVTQSLFPRFTSQVPHCPTSSLSVQKHPAAHTKRTQFSLLDPSFPTHHSPWKTLNQFYRTYVPSEKPHTVYDRIQQTGRD